MRGKIERGLEYELVQIREAHWSCGRHSASAAQKVDPIPRAPIGFLTFVLLVPGVNYIDRVTSHRSSLMAST